MKYLHIGSNMADARQLSAENVPLDFTEKGTEVIFDVRPYTRVNASLFIDYGTMSVGQARLFLSIDGETVTDPSVGALYFTNGVGNHTIDVRDYAFLHARVTTIQATAFRARLNIYAHELDSAATGEQQDSRTIPFAVAERMVNELRAFDLEQEGFSVVIDVGDMRRASIQAAEGYHAWSSAEVSVYGTQDATALDANEDTLGTIDGAGIYSFDVEDYRYVRLVTTTVEGSSATTAALSVYAHDATDEPPSPYGYALVTLSADQTSLLIATLPPTFDTIESADLSLSLPGTVGCSVLTRQGESYVLEGVIAPTSFSANTGYLRYQWYNGATPVGTAGEIRPLSTTTHVHPGPIAKAIVSDMPQGGNVILRVTALSGVNGYASQGTYAFVQNLPARL